VKKPTIIAVGIIPAFICFSACHKTQVNPCLVYMTAQVTKVTGANSVSVNQEIDLTVFYYMNNGCGQFQGLEATSAGNTTIIDLNAKYEGCACTDVLLGGQTIYKFRAANPGLYYLKFLQPDKTYFTDTITVN